MQRRETVFRALIAAINGGKGGGEARKFTRKCHNCNEVGCMKRDCSELKNNNDENDVNKLIIGMIEVEGDDVEANNVQLSSKCIDILGDAGVQGHVSPPSACHKCSNGHGIVKMANRDPTKTHQKDDCTIADEV